MEGKKSTCTGCTYTITFDEDNCVKIFKKQADALVNRKRRSIQQIVNQLIKNSDK